MRRSTVSAPSPGGASARAGRSLCSSGPEIRAHAGGGAYSAETCVSLSQMCPQVDSNELQDVSEAIAGVSIKPRRVLQSASLSRFPTDAQPRVFGSGPVRCSFGLFPKFSTPVEKTVENRRVWPVPHCPTVAFPDKDCVKFDDFQDGDPEYRIGVDRVAAPHRLMKTSDEPPVNRSKSESAPGSGLKSPVQEPN